MAPVCTPLTCAKINMVKNLAKEGLKNKQTSKQRKTVNKRLENHKLESLCLADSTWRLLWRSFNCLRWQRLSEENYHSNEINTCLPPKLKSADSVYDREERFTTSHLKNLVHM